MGVYIRNMVMPSNCMECMKSYLRSAIKCTEWKYLSTGLFESRRANTCPLVELPGKHGDLIDRKVLSGAVLKWMPPDPCGKEEKEFPFEEDICVSMMMEIEEQPTVIEAEGEE